jgi:membrane-bound lytic murein transglycosylase D
MKLTLQILAGKIRKKWTKLQENKQRDHNNCWNRVQSFMSKNFSVLRIGSLLSMMMMAVLANAQNPKDFPRPAELEPAIKFWTRVYTEADTDSGFLHDSVNLAIIYKKVSYDRPEIERQRTRISEDLQILASGKRSGLTGHQQQILEVFPAGVSNSVLAAAADTVRFQLGQSDRFVEGLIRSGAYRQHIDRVTSERNLPVELGALPHVESSFHPGAYSHAAAAGMWQFMRTTGQRFMRIDHIVDERMDPYTSTSAAMSLLEYNYSVLGSWPLALTAYNHGAGGISRAVRETGSERIEDIVANYKGRNFGFASRNFYVQFLAVVDVEKQAQALFGILQLDSHPEYEEFEMEAYVEAQTLASVLGISLDQLKFDNPAIRPIVWEGGKRIPRGYTVKVQRKSLERGIASLMAAIPPLELHTVQTPDLAYVVQRGDSLSSIAGRFKTSVAQLMSLNQLRDAHRIQIGQNLLLPHDNQMAATSSTVASIPSSNRPETAAVVPAAQGRPAAYEVRRGDTLSTIAQRFSMAENELLQINSISDPHKIYPGQRLALRSVDQPTVQTVAFTAAADNTVPAESAEESADAVAVEPLIDAVASIEQAGRELAADPSDYGVRLSDNSIEIQATETLGHYADWLGVNSADIRRWNNLTARQQVVMGKRLILNFSSRNVQEFELKRRQYHIAQQENFFRNYRIQDLDQYTIAANDNISTLARQKYSVPLWLLRQYNPDMDFSTLKIGQKVVFPVLESVQVEVQS